MAETPSSRLIRPPRVTGDRDRDTSAVMEWLYSVYSVLELEGVFLRTSDQFSIPDDFDPGTLPDPSSTTLAQAQQTANDAYTQAFINAIFIQLLLDRDQEWGEVTISGASTTADFTFAAAMDDTDYKVAHGLVASSATPTADARIVKAITKATEKLTLELVAAPGVGESVTFNILVGRNDG